MKYFFRRSNAILFALLPFNLVHLAFGLDPASSIPAVVDSVMFKSQFFEQNERCFRCHGSSKYTYFNQVSEKDVSAIMCENRVIERPDFYAANHKTFACVDCHAAAYDSFPHPGRLRMESVYNCLDCHGYD